MFAASQLVVVVVVSDGESDSSKPEPTCKELEPEVVDHSLDTVALGIYERSIDVNRTFAAIRILG